MAAIDRRQIGRVPQGGFGASVATVEDADPTVHTPLMVATGTDGPKAWWRVKKQRISTEVCLTPRGHTAVLFKEEKRG